MFLQFRVAIAVCLGIAVCLFAGCGEEVAPDATPTESPSIEPVTSQPAVEEETPVTEQPDEESTSATDDLPVSTLDQVSKPTETLAYHAPFPDRVDLFRIPKRQGGSFAATPGNIESAVELLGFVNVDSQQVVLSIDGMVSPLEVGNKVAEIEVISIQPPAVVLQRGRQRWQASLEN